MTLRSVPAIDVALTGPMVDWVLPDGVREGDEVCLQIVGGGVSIRYRTPGTMEWFSHAGLHGVPPVVAL